MVFSSTIFLFFFLPLALLLYYIVPSKFVTWRNVMLIIASLTFYIWGEVYNVALLLGMLVVNYAIGVFLRAPCENSEAPSIQNKILLGIGIVLNLSGLFFYKYLGWLAGLLGLEFMPQVTLPLGISFFTFHAISYLMDIYRRDIKPARNIVDFSCYFVMFPHLVAGPIVRYAHVMDDMSQHRGNFDLFHKGIRRFIIGLAKKMLIANQVAVVADATFSLSPETLGSGTAWLGAIAYSLQIYFDFSAYSDMAIGLAAMFGFSFHENFNHPYGASSMQDFWRKWHISLSSWLRDYLYIPLGGNRKGEIRTYINLVLIFFFCGLWHGANWTFILWGLYHGFFLVIERLGFARWLDSKMHLLTRLYVILAFICGWVLFRADTLTYAFAYLKAMFWIQIKEIPVQVDYKIQTQFWIAFAIGIIASTGLPVHLWRKLKKSLTNRLTIATFEFANLIYGAVIVVLSIMHLLANTYNPFIYFRF